MAQCWSRSGRQPIPDPIPLAQKIAIAVLFLFLVAIVVALAITLASVPAAVGVLAGAVVTPIIVLAALFLFLEWRGRPGSFVGAATLGAVGVALRLVVNSQPQLEVGGGLPVGVTLVYAILGVLVFGTSLWAYFSVRRRDLGDL
jgi:hypothetical protein